MEAGIFPTRNGGQKEAFVSKSHSVSLTVPVNNMLSFPFLNPLTSTLITSTSSLLLIVDGLLVLEYLLLHWFLMNLTNPPYSNFKKHFQVLTLMTSSYLSALTHHFLSRSFFLAPSLVFSIVSHQGGLLTSLSALSTGTSSLCECIPMSPPQILIFLTRESYLIVVLATFNQWMKTETHFLFPSHPRQP